MPDFRTHLVGGGIAGFGVLLLSGIDIKFMEMILAIGVSIVGAMFPDVLEPATSGNHRSFFHSYTVLLIAILFGFMILKNMGSFGSNTLAGLFLVGYISHLLLDVSTPAGLPAIA